MMKVCIGLLVLAVLGGACFIHARRKKSPWRTDSTIQYQATRKLVPNHRIIATDLVEPHGLPGDLYWRLPPRSALEGHYVCCDTIYAGNAVETSNVGVSPVPADLGQKRPFVYSLESKPQLADLLDPGLKATIGDIDVEVDAVRCPSGADPSKPPPCYVMLLVPGDKAEALWKANPLPPVVPKNF